MAERQTSYPPEAILTPEEVAEWLAISTDQLARLGIKRLPLGRGEKRTCKVRYLAKHVLEFFEESAA